MSEGRQPGSLRASPISFDVHTRIHASHPRRSSPTFYNYYSLFFVLPFFPQIFTRLGLLWPDLSRPHRVGRGDTQALRGKAKPWGGEETKEDGAAAAKEGYHLSVLASTHICSDGRNTSCPSLTIPRFPRRSTEASSQSCSRHAILSHGQEARSQQAPPLLIARQRERKNNRLPSASAIPFPPLLPTLSTFSSSPSHDVVHHHAFGSRTLTYPVLPSSALPSPRCSYRANGSPCPNASHDAMREIHPQPILPTAPT